MKEKYKKAAKELGLDLDDTSFPISAEYQKALATKDAVIVKSMEQGILHLLAGLLRIKGYNESDFNYHVRKLNAKDVSFWGERFEIYLYSKLIEDKSILNLRRGVPNVEADFLFKFQDKGIALEATTANFSESQNFDAIAKIKKAIWKKEQKKYASKECCLVVDITNLLFYRRLFDSNKNDNGNPNQKIFKSTISELFQNLSSPFGAILLNGNYHLRDEDKYVSDAYTWRNAEINDGLSEYLNHLLQPSLSTGKDVLYFSRM